MNSDILDNLEKRIFFHGTSLEAAEAIAQSGFKVWFTSEELERYPSGGNLGNGIYLSCNWRTALWFGPTVLRLGIRPGTKFLNAALPPDRKIVNYLQREFGREILRKDPRRVVPKNKKLESREFVALFRFHYRNAWVKYDFQWPARRKVHLELLKNFKSLLIRYGFHGYGNPDDYNGIVVFAEDRLSLEEIVAKIPRFDYSPVDGSDCRQFRNIGELREFFRCHGSRRALELAEQVAAAAGADKQRP